MSQSKILLESGTNELEIVEFYVDEADYRGHYGINVAKVVEIIRNQSVTAMPEMRHPSVKGIFAHRNGQVIPLIDLSNYLGGGDCQNSDSKIIITEFNTVTTAFRVSGVNRIYRLSWTDVESPSKFLEHAVNSSVTGMVKLDERVVFLIDLEAIVGAMHPHLAISMDEKPGVNLPPQPYRVLHVDDSTSIRKMVFRLLESTGKFEITQANDGQEAWNLLCRWRDEAALNKTPMTDVVEGIVTDIEMPNMDGLTLCRKIKEDAVLKNLPVAVFSSLINDSLRVKARSVGADAEFTKPDLQTLSEKVIELILSKKSKSA